MQKSDLPTWGYVSFLFFVVLFHCCFLQKKTVKHQVKKDSVFSFCIRKSREGPSWMLRRQVLLSWSEFSKSSGPTQRQPLIWVFSLMYISGKPVGRLESCIHIYILLQRVPLISSSSTDSTGINCFVHTSPVCKYFGELAVPGGKSSRKRSANQGGVPGLPRVLPWQKLDSEETLGLGCFESKQTYYCFYRRRVSVVFNPAGAWGPSRLLLGVSKREMIWKVISVFQTEWF